MEKYHSGDYNKWDSTKCLSDQMLLYSLYYTTNQEEILLAKETLQQVSMEMQQVENKAKKDNTISVAKEIGSFGISLISFLGDGKDLQESISGLDLITGKKLSALERVLAGACVIVPVISGSMVRIAGKNADIAEKMSLLSEKQLFNTIKQVPPTFIVHGNKWRVGTCLYQEGYKPLLICCTSSKSCYEQVAERIANIRLKKGRKRHYYV